MTPRERLAWILAGTSLVLAALAVAWPAAERQDLPVPAFETSAIPSEAPPDLSTLSPRDQFDRLYNRVMRAAETGNTAEVTRFAPMAFAAYRQLPEVDADARYHAAVLHLHVAGDTAPALRLADSISADTPRHLFAALIRGTAGRQAGNPGLLAAAQRDLLAAWEGEMRADRPEYRDHRNMLDQFREAALRARRPQ